MIILWTAIELAITARELFSSGVCVQTRPYMTLHNYTINNFFLPIACKIANPIKDCFAQDSIPTNCSQKI